MVSLQIASLSTLESSLNSKVFQSSVKYQYEIDTSTSSFNIYL